MPLEGYMLLENGASSDIAIGMPRYKGGLGAYMRHFEIYLRAFCNSGQTANAQAKLALLP